MSSTRSGRTVHATKRYRPDELPRGVSAPEEHQEPEGEEPVRRVRSTIRSLPEILTAASKAQHDTLMAMLKEMTTHTALLKRSVRIISETQDAILDIHEGLAIVTKDTAPPPTPPPQAMVVAAPPLNVSKEDIQVPTLPLE